MLLWLLLEDGDQDSTRAGEKMTSSIRNNDGAAKNIFVDCMILLSRERTDVMNGSNGFKRLMVDSKPKTKKRSEQ